MACCTNSPRSPPRNEHFPDHEKANPEMDAWTDRFVRKLLHAPGSPNLAQRIYSAVAK